MKSSIILILLSSLITAQPVLEENFDYSAGAFNVVQASWTSSGGTEANIVDGNLSYPGYLFSSIGKQLNITSSTTSDYDRALSTTFESGKMYLSFLLNVTDQTGLTGNTSAGDYFLHLKSGATNVVLLYIRKGAGDSDFQLGIKKKTGSTTSYLASTLAIGQTHLVIISYSFSSATTTDDQIMVWVNPAVAAFEPVPDLTFSDEQTDVSSINKIAIRQGSSTPNAFIDGMCVTASWSEVPLPVELISFTASYQENSIKLKWQTASEINNMGWEIERASASTPPGMEWKKIGFVKGRNNSAGEYYSFIDKDINSSEISYRLKQIDLDGTSSFSKEVKVIIPSKGFTVFQNYPNPFNPETKMKWMQPEAGRIKIDLYNVIGSYLSSLLDDEMEAGIHQVNFHSGNLASGIYLVKIKFKEQSYTRKIHLLK